MSSKDQKPSKKAVREKKERAIEDATFGLKNKNKSKKVQQFINRVEKSVKNQNGGVDAVRRSHPWRQKLHSLINLCSLGPCEGAEEGEQTGPTVAGRGAKKAVQ